MQKPNRGFTLMELVTVISIMGVLAAMTVPKFFGMQGKARIETENMIIGNIHAGLSLYASNELVTNFVYSYPPASSTAFLDEILNPIPEGWDTDATNQIRHTRTDSTITWPYTENGDSYTIGARVAVIN